MKRNCLILSLPILLALSSVGQAQAFSNDCSLQFAGSYRKAVKNRPASAGADYTVHNDGQPITVDDWFGLVCGFDPKLRQTNVTTGTPVLQGFETTKVTLEGFLLGARFERKVHQGDGKDNDFHLEISDSQSWKSRHVIVEVPPGPEWLRQRQMHSHEPGEDTRDRVHLSRCRTRQDVQDQTRDGESGRERRGGSMGDPSRTLSGANQSMIWRICRASSRYEKSAALRSRSSLTVRTWLSPRAVGAGLISHRNP